MNAKRKMTDFMLTSKTAAIVSLIVSLFISVANSVWVWPVVLLDGLFVVVLIV